MSGQDLRKIMNLMESVESQVEEAVVEETEEVLDEAHESLSTMLWKIYSFGKNNNESRASQYVNMILDHYAPHESRIEEAVEDDEAEQLEESIQGEPLDDVLLQIFNYGRSYGKTGMTSAYNVATELMNDLVAVYGNTIPGGPVAEDVVMETGNGNAQQKGINFNGTKAAKGDGAMPRKMPGTKRDGGKTPMAQQKSGTNVGQIKS